MVSFFIYELAYKRNIYSPKYYQIFDNDDEAAAQIMLAANYGGRAINITATTAAHAMSYKITSFYGLPHGHAVAICLPHIWKYMIEHLENCIDTRGVNYLKQIFDNISIAMRCKNPVEAIDLFENMMSELQLGHPVSENLSSDILLLASSVNPVRLKNNPVELNQNVIKEIYKQIVKWWHSYDICN